MNKQEYDKEKLMLESYRDQAIERLKSLIYTNPIYRIHWTVLKEAAEAKLKILEILGYDDNEVYRTGERQLDTRIDGLFV